MRYLVLLLFSIFGSSCFLLPAFRKDEVAFGNEKYTVSIPRSFHKKEARTDSSGNQEVYYHYSDGTILYFVKVADTNILYQPIEYGLNDPKILYDALFYKGIDSSYNHYWRENRMRNYKAGYIKAAAGSEWLFDSALNSFSKRLRPIQ